MRHALADFIGCFLDAGPTRTPDDRPYVERFFGSIAASLSSRLPGYTGTNARDLRRALADPKGDLRLYVSLAEIEELLEASIAAYNAMPHDGLNGRTPLEAVEHSVRGRGAILNWLPEAKRRTLCLMQTPKRATVRGYLHPDLCARWPRDFICIHLRQFFDVLASSTRRLSTFMPCVNMPANAMPRCWFPAEKLVIIALRYECVAQWEPDSYSLDL